ncbi:FHA domain-containing protein [Bacteroides sp. UBA939]|uniref:FHA domain-containing protein n=1 Tax=Bacteroides sp. UBA939 TaxID=1946092 RepID=UPI0025BF3F48|nr:FHA domain-containing protein [Bacteroides sp. UBA939]
MSTLVNCPKCRVEIESDSYYCDQCGVELYMCPQCRVFGKGKRCTLCGQPLVSAKDSGSGVEQPGAPSSSVGMGNSGNNTAGKTFPGTAAGTASMPGGQAVSGTPANPVASVSGTSANPVPSAVSPTPSPAASVPPQPVESPVQPPAPSTFEPEKTMRPGVVAAPGPTRLVCSAARIRLELGDGAVIGRRQGDYVSAFASQGYVSGSHARLQKNPSGKWEVVDLDSTNGTFVNGKRLSPNVPVEFNIGDVVRIATLDFKVE